MFGFVAHRIQCLDVQELEVNRNKETEKFVISYYELFFKGFETFSRGCERFRGVINFMRKI